MGRCCSHNDFDENIHDMADDDACDENDHGNLVHHKIDSHRIQMTRNAARICYSHCYDYFFDIFPHGNRVVVR